MPLPQHESWPLYRGDTFGVVATCYEDEAQTTPSDFTGATVRAQVRPSADSTTIIAEFAVTVDGNALILVLSPEQTAILPPKSVCDVQVDWHSDGTAIQTILAADLPVTADVTRISP